MFKETNFALLIFVVLALFFLGVSAQDDVVVDPTGSNDQVCPTGYTKATFSIINADNNYECVSWDDVKSSIEGRECFNNTDASIYNNGPPVTSPDNCAGAPGFVCAEELNSEVSNKKLRMKCFLENTRFVNDTCDAHEQCNGFSREGNTVACIEGQCAQKHQELTGKGETCNHIKEDDITTYVGCESGFQCLSDAEGENRCFEIIKNGQDGTCNQIDREEYETETCEDGFYCDGGTCEEKRAEDESCSNSFISPAPCKDDLYCSSDLVCEPLKADGENCTMSTQCENTCVFIDEQESYKQCMTLKDEGESCNHMDQCQPEYTCGRDSLDEANTQEFERRCKERVYLHEFCIHDNDCVGYAGSSYTTECLNNECVRSFGQLNGELCTDNDHCHSGVCDTFRQECVENEVKGGCEFGCDYCAKPLESITQCDNHCLMDTSDKCLNSCHGFKGDLVNCLAQIGVSGIPASALPRTSPFIDYESKAWKECGGYIRRLFQCYSLEEEIAMKKSDGLAEERKYITDSGSLSRYSLGSKPTPQPILAASANELASYRQAFVVLSVCLSMLALLF